MSKTPEQKLEEMGLKPSAPILVPAGYESPVLMAKRLGDVLYLAGHLPLNQDGSLATEYLGKLGDELTLEQGREAARLAALAMLGTIKAEVGELSKVKSWVKVLGMVNSAPDFVQQSQVINAFSELIVDIFGEDIGLAARSAVGMGAMPSNIPLEIEAIVELHQ